MPQKADIDPGPMPLADALDQLTRIYHDTEWEWRRLGFIVVRGPRNMVRTPSPDAPPEKSPATPAKK